jgi:hypothetical protein
MESMNQIAETAGLCSTCLHAQLIESSKGSVFLLCQLSKTDARFPKYPRLPVLSCAGYKRRNEIAPLPNQS